MSTILQMAEAHLQTVQKAINDLQNQKNSIDQEISKLTDYLKRGVEELNKNKPEPESTSKEVKHYLGD